MLQPITCFLQRISVLGEAGLLRKSLMGKQANLPELFRAVSSQQTGTVRHCSKALWAFNNNNAHHQSGRVTDIFIQGHLQAVKAYCSKAEILNTGLDVCTVWAPCDLFVLGPIEYLATVNRPHAASDR